MQYRALLPSAERNEMSPPSMFFADFSIVPDLEADLRRLNPWWEDDPLPLQPPTRRHLVGHIRRRMDAKTAPIVVVRGPRQIGKTTAQFQIIQDLLNEGVRPRRILRVQFDEIESFGKLKEPILRVSDWFERHVAPKRFNAMAHDGEPAFLFFDEIQNLKGWDAQLKSLVDNATVSAVVTGSSALRIERGRDSLAGRINTIEAGVLSLTEIGAFRNLSPPDPFLKDNGLSDIIRKAFWEDLREHGMKNHPFRDEAFASFSERGGYPLVHENRDIDFSELADQLNETVIKRVIQHDLRIGDRGAKRDASLLEHLFRLACRYAGQAPRVSTLAEDARLTLDANIGSQRVSNYMKFLSETLLLRLIPPLEIRLKKKRGSSKICLADHGLRASWLQENVPLAPEQLIRSPELSTLAGHLAESVFGATLSTINGLDISHFPRRGNDQEVDFVLTVGDTRIPIEIKYQMRIDQHRDTLGLRSFLEKSANNAPFGILVTLTDSDLMDDRRIVSLPLSTLMLIR